MSRPRKLAIVLIPAGHAVELRRSRSLPSGGRVFVTDQRYDCCSSTFYTVAYDATSGTPIWTANDELLPTSQEDPPTTSRSRRTGSPSTWAAAAA